MRQYEKNVLLITVFLITPVSREANFEVVGDRVSPVENI